MKEVREEVHEEGPEVPEVEDGKGGVKVDNEEEGSALLQVEGDDGMDGHADLSYMKDASDKSKDPLFEPENDESLHPEQEDDGSSMLQIEDDGMPLSDMD